MTNKLDPRRLGTLRDLWRMLIPQERRYLVFLLAMTFLATIFETLGIGMIIPAVGLFTQPDYAQNLSIFSESLKNLSQSELILIGMSVLVAVYFVKNIFLVVFLWTQSLFGMRIQMRLSHELFRKYLHLPYVSHLDRNSATLIRNIEICGNVSNYGLNPMMLLITESLVLLSLLVLLITVEPIGAVSVIGILGFATFAYQRATKSRIRRWSQLQIDHSASRFQHLQQGLGGIKDVILLGREKEFLGQYEYHNVSNAEVGRRFAVVQQLPRMWLETLAVFGLGLLVYLMLLQGQTVGDILPKLALFGATAFRLMPSANRILNSIQLLGYGRSTIETLSAEFALEERTIPQYDLTRTLMSREIDLNRVSFKYLTAPKPSLDEVSLSVRFGESIGIVGTSGAGKSTLVDVILGLLKPSKGKVFVDGKDIHENLRNWQDQVGYVPQSIYLTDDTLLRNIAFGLVNEEISQEAVWRALAVAQLIDFVKTLPDGLATVVGERGIRLSGGQRQRIGIARALYHDPSILILDEATSSLDVETEHGVMQAVNSLHGTKTIIIVAHRLSTVEYCDRLYRLENGCVMQEGTFKEVVTSFRPDENDVIKHYE